MTTPSGLPAKPAGLFNAAKCAQYLRWIGVELEDEQVESWGLSERVHRFLRSQRRTTRECGACWCRHGHEWFAVTYRGHLTKAKRAANDDAARCPECGEAWTAWAVVWAETREGAVHDFRPKGELWKPLPLHETEAP